MDAAASSRLVREGSLLPAVVFVALAFLGAWIVCLPLWLSDRGLELPLAPLLLIVMMATPAAAALLTHRLFRHGRLTAVLGVGLGPWRRWWPYALVAWLGPIVLSAMAVALAVMLGVFRVDLQGFSGYAQVVSARGPLPIPISLLVVLTGAQMIFAPFLNAIFASGEELGWRGYLRDTLLDLPRSLLILITGVVWGLWHAPIVLLGYNYPDVPPAKALGLMVVFTTLLSALLEWLRAASGTIWVPALAHGSLNGAAGLALLVSHRDFPVDPVSTGLLGWTGWIVLGGCIAGLGVSGRLSSRPRALRRA